VIEVTLFIDPELSQIATTTRLPATVLLSQITAVEAAKVDVPVFVWAILIAILETVAFLGVFR